MTTPGLEVQTCLSLAENKFEVELVGLMHAHGGWWRRGHPPIAPAGASGPTQELVVLGPLGWESLALRQVA